MESLASLADWETYLGRPADDPYRAQSMLDMASSAVRAYCGWVLSRTTETMHIEGTGSTLITLPTLCLRDITAIRADGIGINPLDFSDSGAFNFSRKGQVWGCWAPKVQYEFDVDHGYEPTPDVLKLVTMDLATRQVANPEGLSSVTVGQVTKTWGTSRQTGTTAGHAMPVLHAGLLDRFSLFNP